MPREAAYGGPAGQPDQGTLDAATPAPSARTAFAAIPATMISSKSRCFR